MSICGISQWRDVNLWDLTMERYVDSVS
jgi:hypothetical protein